jgi:hypothetical protein
MLCVTVVCGCSGGGGEPSTGGAAPVRPADTLPIPGQAGALPPGHPPTTASGKLVWEAPDGWNEVRPSSNMRYAQYEVEGPGGTAECVVFYFGPNQGGDPMANANRWAGQFSQPDGGDSLERMSMTALDGTSVPIQIVEVTGTYAGGMTASAEPFEPKADYMLLGGIAEGPDAPWFFKFTGPEKTVRSQRDAFIEMMSSIRSES